MAAVRAEREAHAAFDDADAAYRDAPSVPTLLSLGAATDALRDATAHTDAAIAGCS